MIQTGRPVGNLTEVLVGQLQMAFVVMESWSVPKIKDSVTTLATIQQHRNVSDQMEHFVINPQILTVEMALFLVLTIMDFVERVVLILLLIIVSLLQEASVLGLIMFVPTESRLARPLKDSVERVVLIQPLIPVI